MRCRHLTNYDLKIQDKIPAKYKKKQPKNTKQHWYYVVDNLANKQINLTIWKQKKKYQNIITTCNFGWFCCYLKKKTHTHTNKKKQNKQYNKPSSFSPAPIWMVALGNSSVSRVNGQVERKAKHSFLLLGAVSFVSSSSLPLWGY